MNNLGEHAESKHLNHQLPPREAAPNAAINAEDKAAGKEAAASSLSKAA